MFKRINVNPDCIKIIETISRLYIRREIDIGSNARKKEKKENKSKRGLRGKERFQLITL